MTAPTSDRPLPRDDRDVAALHVADDLDRAYRAAAALADDDRAPAAAVRANVLAAARAMALDAAARAPSTPPVDPVPTPQPMELTIPGIGRALAANLSSWRVRAGAAACVALMAAAIAWRFDDRLLRPDEDTNVASVDLLPSRDPRLARVAASPGVTLAPPPVASEPQPERVATAAAAAASADVAPAAAAPQVVAQADTDKPAARSLRAQAPDGVASDVGRAVDKVVVAEAAPDDVSNPVAATAAPKSVATPRMAQAARVAAVPTPPVVVALAPPPAPAPVAPVFSAAAPRAAPMAQAAPSLPSPTPDAQGGIEISSSSIQRTDAASDAAAADTRVAMAKSSVGSMASLGGTSERAPTLQRAADAGDTALIARLLATGMAVDAADADGRTALLHAVLAQQGAAVRTLLAAGADPMRADASGLTPRAAARRGADAAIAAMFAPR